MFTQTQTHILEKSLRNVNVLIGDRRPTYIKAEVYYTKVKVGNDHEIVQSDRNSHPKKSRWEKTKLTVRNLY